MMVALIVLRSAFCLITPPAFSLRKNAIGSAGFSSSYSQAAGAIASPETPIRHSHHPSCRVALQSGAIDGTTRRVDRDPTGP